MPKKPKRSKRVKQSVARPGSIKQLQPQVSIPSQEQLVDYAQLARQHMLMGNFADCISTCELALNSLPRHSGLRLEILALLGLAHGMLKHYQQSCDIFSEAIGIDPTRAELWYNHGLACHSLARYAEAVQDFEHAVALSKNDKSEMASKFAVELKAGRRELQEATQAYGMDITFEHYMEIEKRFTQALSLSKQEKWQEAELLFRQLTEVGSRIPSYWGNLGVCLLMQSRYDEAEEVLKRALAIAPDYPIARDNLKKLPAIRRSKQPPGHRMITVSEDEEDARESLALYEKNSEGEVINRTVVEKAGHAVTSTWRQFGKQSPRYDFFLNTYQDTRFTTCPRCNIKTRSRKFSLVMNVEPEYTLILDKMCRFCPLCGLLIVHQDQLEAHLLFRFMTIKPEALGHDYRVIGTLDRAEWNREKQDPLSYEHLIEHLHDFREIVTFERALV